MSLFVFRCNYVCILYLVPFLTYAALKWHDRGIWVCGRSTSLKMALFDRPHTTFSWSAIANIALSCTIFKMFNIE